MSNGKADVKLRNALLQIAVRMQLAGMGKEASVILEAGVRIDQLSYAQGLAVKLIQRDYEGSYGIGYKDQLVSDTYAALTETKLTA